MRGNSAAEVCPGVGQEKLAIEVTTRCNGSCLHCFARSGISRPSSLPGDLVKGIIVEGYDAGYRHLHITGGEPLLWQGLSEALDYAFDVGYETIFMNTNGTLMTEEMSRKLAAYPRFSISVSLEGPEVLHDRIRGAGSYRRTMQGIERALNAGNNLTIFTTVTKSLLPELPHFADDLYKKFPSIYYLILIQLIRITKGPFALSGELLEPKHFLRLVRTVALLNLYGLRSVVKKNPLANVVSKLIEMPWIPRVPPLYCEGSLIVMANRHISVVHSNRDTFERYRPGVIRKVLDSEAYRKAVAPDERTCPSCKYTYLCRENGMIRPSQGHEDLHAHTPYCRRVLDKIPSAQTFLGGNPDGREACACSYGLHQRRPRRVLRVFDRSILRKLAAPIPAGAPTHPNEYGPVKIDSRADTDKSLKKERRNIEARKRDERVEGGRFSDRTARHHKKRSRALRN